MQESGYRRAVGVFAVAVPPPSPPRGRCVGELSPNADHGDGDPLDICVVSKRPTNRSEIFLSAKVVGGLQVVDRKEADDKIIAVLDNDNVWGSANSLEDLPGILIERLSHYFATYKLVPGEQEAVLSIEDTYGQERTLEVVTAALADYEDEFGQ